MQNTSQAASQANNTSKDIEALRNPNELPHIWQLRKEFLQIYADKFEADRLVCLSQIFVNVECMGLSYPEEVMSLVKELGSKVKGLEFYKHMQERDEPEPPRKPAHGRHGRQQHY